MSSYGSMQLCAFSIVPSSVRKISILVFGKQCSLRTKPIVITGVGFTLAFF